jgi:hypothetical protein
VSFKTTKSLTDFANDAIDSEKFFAEHAASSITVNLIMIEAKEDGSVDLYHETEPTTSEKTTLDSLIASHDGQPFPKFRYLAPTKLVDNEINVTENTNWQDLGAIVTTLGGFISDVSKAWGRVVGDVKTDGSGAELRVIRESDGAVLMAAAHSVGDTSAAWVHAQFWVTQNQPADTDCFILQGRLNGATSFKVRYMSMSLLEKFA